MKMTIDSLLNKYEQRVPYEDRGKNYDKKRKREERQKELKLITEELFSECEDYKRLRLTIYQKERVHYIVKQFANNFKMLHSKAKTETIILAFIFYIKLNEEPKIKLNQYKITSKYDLSDNIFEIIICKLAEYYMQRMPIVPVGSTNYDHEILCKNGGKK